LFSILCLFPIFSIHAESEVFATRGLFVSMIQDPQALSSRDGVSELINFSKKARIKTLFVQIYRANQAWFSSQVGDSSRYEAALKEIGEDPFQLLIKEAHKQGIEVHAWLNLLSLAQNKNAPMLQKYGSEILTKNLKDKKTLEDYKIDSQYFLEPGDPRVGEELSNLVGEILEAYPDLDGIQFDYIRYPDKDPHYGFTKMNVERFKKATGIQIIEEKSAVWQNWKRAQVTELLELLIKKTKSIRPDLKVSTTGCMSYSRAYHEAFQDWPGWVNSGLIDFVTIMSYKRDPAEFQKQIEDARSRVSDFGKVNIGIGAYELLNLSQDFTKQSELCEQARGGDCVIFHYGNLLESTALKRAVYSGH